MRQYFIAGNWKMNKTPSEAVALAEEVKAIAEKADCRVMIAPSFVCLPAVVNAVKGSSLVVAAQNMATVESGAHTGEISVLMLKDIGVEVVIIGHSERRLIYGEQDDFINRKVHLALKHGLEVILCVGETLEQREANETMEVVKAYLEETGYRNFVLIEESVHALAALERQRPDRGVDHRLRLVSSAARVAPRQPRGVVVDQDHVPIV